MKKIGLKAPENYSASFWSDTCPILLCEKPTPNISMVSGFLRPVGTLIYGFEYTKLLEQSKKTRNHFLQTRCFENSDLVN